MIRLDVYSVLGASFVGAVGFYVGGCLDFVFRWVVVKMLTFPKTSALKELKNKEIKCMGGSLGTVAGLNAVLLSVRRNPNLKVANATYDIERILRAVHTMRDDLVLSGMDYLVIHRCGVGLLILKFDKEATGEEYDRSIFVDITHLRSELFRCDRWIAFYTAFIAFLLCGEENTRAFVMELVKSVF